MEQWHNVYNYPHAPDDCIEQEIGRFQSRYDVIRLILEKMASHDIEIYLEQLSLEEMYQERRAESM